jgi:hypothetical protein
MKRYSFLRKARSKIGSEDGSGNEEKLPDRLMRFG